GGGGAGGGGWGDLPGDRGQGPRPAAGRDRGRLKGRYFRGAFDFRLNAPVMPMLRFRPWPYVLKARPDCCRRDAIRKPREHAKKSSTQGDGLNEASRFFE